MVCYVSTDVVMDVVDKSIVTVNSRNRALEKIPAIVAVPGNIRLCVVQEGDQVQPYDKHQIGMT